LFSWRKQYREAVERAAPASSSISLRRSSLRRLNEPATIATVAVAAPLIELEFGSGISFGSLGLSIRIWWR